MSAQLRHVDAASNHADLGELYRQVRAQTLALSADLAPEDTVAQSMPDASPVKWHLAHTTWFFEEFLLSAFVPAYRRFADGWAFLFNSYYQAVGPMHARPQRGLLTRPTLREIVDYRHAVDAAMQRLLQDRGADDEVRSRVVLGLNHEQQHQELLLTDIQHLFSLNPLQPVFRAPRPAPTPASAVPLRFIEGTSGALEIGHAGSGFAFDNEGPRHREWVAPHALANRCATNAEFREFIDAGGYRQPHLWLSEGWDTVRRAGWRHPLYWSDDLETTFSLGGRQPLDPLAPVCHLSFFEADAFARWAGARLPTEAEWECAAAPLPVAGNFADSGLLRALPARAAAPDDQALLQMFGDVWEWTGSPYIGYPGFHAAAGALGEYNGKFMCGQWVLRGGSCATPAGHVRATYRNFFAPAARWQFSGVRLARDA